MEEEGYVAHVRLHLSECERKFVMMLVSDIAVRAELEVVVSDQSDNIREKIATLKRKVLKNEVQCIIGILDTWNWKVFNLPGL